VKRHELERHLSRHGCSLRREGSNHAWWHNETTNRRSAVPRHREISDVLTRKICRDLDIPAPGEASD